MTPYCTVLYDAAPIAGRMNEDAYLVQQTPTLQRFVVVDGAAQRIPTQRTADLFRGAGLRATGAVYAARTIIETAMINPSLTPRQIMLAANTALRTALEDVYGELSAQHIAAQEPDAAPHLAGDPRLVRLALPVAVATILEIDPVRGAYQFAHAGDTTLLAWHADGRVVALTQDQMRRYDEAAVRHALSIQRETGAPRLADVLSGPAANAVNWQNGLYHNYVSENGAPDPERGVGVVNGLPDLRHYIQTGGGALDAYAGFILLTDGAMWPTPLDESRAQMNARLRHMLTLMRQEGLAAYGQALRAEEAADADLVRYPRFKVHDDCTALFIALT
ncbi:MAG: hypothetical protein ACLFTK_14770 [Anaerolineales bacterium]